MPKKINYFIWRVAIVLLLVSSSSLAGFKKIDKGSKSWPKNSGYWLLFVARDYMPGHAFVVWAVRDRKNNTWRSYQGFGLYPKNSKEAAFGTVPGYIVRESIKSLNSIDNGLAVAVTKKMYDYAYVNTKAISSYPVSYHLLNDNCVNFTDLVARAISLNTPKIFGAKQHPQGYINALKNNN